MIYNIIINNKNPVIMYVMQGWIEGDWWWGWLGVAE